ncbi:MAG: glutamate 5-kinase [Steroidobacteraceae bacterium]
MSEVQKARQDHRLARARRIVVKVGSSLLVDAESGSLNHAWIASLTRDLLRLRERGQQILIVSSGAIALGRRQLKLPRRGLRLEASQAAAAVGQISLAHAYKDLWAQHGVHVAQVLLTLEDSERRRRYLNARATLLELIKLDVVAVVNENDTVATSEIRYGDNDRLAARVAQMVSADCLVLLSDVDGLYSADPATDTAARIIPEVADISDEIAAMAGATRSEFGSGGMSTKLAAARIAVAAGCHMCIASGRHELPLSRIEAGAACTWFVPQASPAAARKQWIAGTLRPSGAVSIDAGAVAALLAGKSLLPAGVTDAHGSFERGDTVSVLLPDGRELGRGIIAYSDVDARQIMGRRSSDIAGILGFSGRDEMIHRDDLAVLSREPAGRKAQG